MKSIAIIPVYGEAPSIGTVLERFEPGFVDEICLVVDEPSPRTLKLLDEASQGHKVPIHTIRNPQRNGIGFAIRQGYEYALDNEYDLIVVLAGNGKDDPREIPRLTTPIMKEGIDYVQGSRFLPGGRRERNPFLRSIFTRLFPVVWTSMTGVHCTEVTNGFRAYKSSILRDPRVNVWQKWLDNYELEYYLHYKALTLGYRFIERPVSKDYTEIRKGKYSHISPLRDWWQIVGPVFMLKLGVKK
ncbi:MAG TPA: glycosyltransferase family 2 protein [Candidatus Bathyarchaeia archaeon]|nr:glycosyltransferase family 2 protein [Candidatus Bathyarchaeia archaeon]